MQAAEIIARSLGPVYLIAGLGMLVATDSYLKMIKEFWKSPALTCLGGFLAAIVGFLILAVLAEWRADWTLLITLIGWVAVFKGAALLIAPRLLSPISRLFDTPARLRLWATPPLLLGALLAAYGYGLV